jgi:hypothetical protein
MVLRTVTTVWCTELGTTLLIGFESTTVIPAYFRCLSPSSVHQPAASNQVPFPLALRHAGAPLLGNLYREAELSRIYAAGSNGTSL